MTFVLHQPLSKEWHSGHLLSSRSGRTVTNHLVKFLWESCFLYCIFTFNLLIVGYISRLETAIVALFEFWHFLYIFSFSSLYFKYFPYCWCWMRLQSLNSNEFSTMMDFLIPKVSRDMVTESMTLKSQCSNFIHILRQV